MADNWQSKNLDRAVQTARTFSQVSHRLGIIVYPPASLRAAITRLHSAVSFHQGLFDAPYPNVSNVRGCGSKAWLVVGMA